MKFLYGFDEKKLQKSTAEIMVLNYDRKVLLKKGTIFQLIVLNFVHHEIGVHYHHKCSKSTFKYF